MGSRSRTSSTTMIPVEAGRAAAPRPHDGLMVYWHAGPCKVCDSFPFLLEVAMLARALSCAVVGLDSALVEVEVDLSQGLPAFTIVGLPDTAVNEAKERVRAAIRNSGLHFPMRRITVNLAPADLRKEGPSYDLPMAVALLAASEQIALEPARHLFLGE